MWTTSRTIRGAKCLNEGVWLIVWVNKEVPEDKQNSFTVCLMLHADGVTNTISQLVQGSWTSSPVTPPVQYPLLHVEKPQQGCPYQGHRTVETSTELPMKFTMWNTCTRKDTEKEEKKGICIHQWENYVDMEAFVHKATEKNIFALKPVQQHFWSKVHE